jgi:DNA mismatch repair protein MutS2
VIDGLKEKANSIAREAASRHVVSTGAAGAARSDARAAVDAVMQRALEPAGAPSPPAPESPAGAARAAVGDRVIFGALGLEAVVTAIHENSADLDVRGKRMRASLSDLRVVGTSPAAGKVSVRVDLQPRETMPVDLNVIGCSVDEALAKAERFLDESLLNDQRTIRVIHGYGTGQLKRALAGFLQQHPLVAKVATAPPDQGGGGVTVVELKD